MISLKFSFLMLITLSWHKCLKLPRILSRCSVTGRSSCLYSTLKDSATKKSRSSKKTPSISTIEVDDKALADSKKRKSTKSKNQVDDGKILVIVESPAKVKTIQKYLDSDKYIVESCVGHIRDLTTSMKTAPEQYKKQYISKELGLSIGSMGVDVHNNFQPIYIISPKKEDVVKKLKSLMKGCSSIILATDDDREGEAISWHLVDTLQPKIPYKRAVFHEVTKAAILSSFENLRDINYHLVESQETRRILDRLTGFTLSPVLWRYISRGLSAGRVQSCGLKLIVDREKKRWEFVSASYYAISATLCTIPIEAQELPVPRLYLPSKLISVNGIRVATEKDFDPSTGEIKGQQTAASTNTTTTTTATSKRGSKKGQENTIAADVSSSSSSSTPDVLVITPEWAQSILHWLTNNHTLSSSHSTSSIAFTQDNEKVNFIIDKVDRKEISRSAPLPYITSSLQMDASTKLKLAPSVTMSIAQELYEKGFITYMRTDSTTLSTSAQTIIKNIIQKDFGATYLGEAITKSSKSSSSSSSSSKKNTPAVAAQEAHEAIRPAEVASETKDGIGRFNTPDEVNLDGIHRALYTLIYTRAVASMMASSIRDSVGYSIKAAASQQQNNKGSTKLTTTTRIKTSSKSIQPENDAISVAPSINEVMFRASFSQLKFTGFTKVYETYRHIHYGIYADSTSNNQDMTPYMSLQAKQEVYLCSTDSLTKADTQSDIGIEANTIHTTDDDNLESQSSSSSISNNDKTDNDNADNDNDQTLSNNTNSKYKQDYIQANSIIAVPSTTKPPNRFSEASFVKELETIGVGRPSTYSSILSILKDREYIHIDKHTILPTMKGVIVNNLLENHFSNIVNSTFTANMESVLDEIAHGLKHKTDFLNRFYLGTSQQDSSTSLSSSTDGIHDKSGDNTPIKNYGLLQKAIDIVMEDKLDHKATRTIQLPFLKDAPGQLILSSYGVVLEKPINESTDSTVSAEIKTGESTTKKASAKTSKSALSSDSATTTSSSSSSSSPSSSSSGSNMKRWILPQNMQLDIRTLSEEALRQVVETQVSTLGATVGMYQQGDKHLPMYIKSGLYGKYLQIGENTDPEKRTVSLPEWVEANDVSQDELLEYLALPKYICTHPITQLPIHVQVRSKLLAVTMTSNIVYYLPENTRLSDVDETMALSCFDYITPEVWKEICIGIFENAPVLIKENNFKNGYVLKWVDKQASLGKEKPLQMTLDEALQILEERGRVVYKSKTTNKTKSTSTTTTTATTKEKKAADKKEKEGSTDDTKKTRSKTTETATEKKVTKKTVTKNDKVTDIKKESVTPKKKTSVASVASSSKSTSTTPKKTTVTKKANVKIL